MQRRAATAPNPTARSASVRSLVGAALTSTEIDGKEVEVKDQIQLYATNVQLTHPIVSPVLQPSLGGLPPCAIEATGQRSSCRLYILCGDSEVLRDEIIYLAHRAARPLAYPLRKELLEANPDRTRLAKKFNEQPTKVHLQCFDGACHVLVRQSAQRRPDAAAALLLLPVSLRTFSMSDSECRPATYCFRAIASFCIANTAPAPPTHDNGASTPVPQKSDHQTLDGLVNRPAVNEDPGKARLPLDFGLKWRDKARESRSVSSPVTPASSSTSIASSPIDRPLSKSRLRELVETVYSAERPFHRPGFKCARAHMNDADAAGTR